MPRQQFYTGAYRTTPHDYSGIARAGEAYGGGLKALGQTVGIALETGIKSYFKGQEEKQMAENMADNPIVMDVVYAGREAPADRGQKIKDIRGVIRASGGYENFLARIDKAKTEQRLVASDKLAQDLANQQKTLFEQGQQLRTENEDLARFLTTRPEGALAPEGRTAAIQAGRAGRQFDPEVRRGRQDLLSDRFREPTLSPVEAGLPERFRSQAAAIVDSGLDPRSKAAAMGGLQAQAASEQARADELRDKKAFEKYKAKLAEPTGPKDTTGPDVTNNAIGRAMGKIGSFSTGFGAYLKGIPGTDAKELSNLLDTVRANIGFDKLQAMREASPTGGVLGQVSEKELQFLQGVFGNLDQSNSDDELTYNLKLLQHVYNNLVHAEGNHPYPHPDDLTPAGAGAVGEAEVEALREELARKKEALQRGVPAGPATPPAPPMRQGGSGLREAALERQRGLRP